LGGYELSVYIPSRTVLGCALTTIAPEETTGDLMGMLPAPKFDEASLSADWFPSCRKR